MPPVADSNRRQICAVLIGQKAQHDIIAVKNFDCDCLIRRKWIPRPPGNPVTGQDVDAPDWKGR
jgi:hypothetical protein